MRIKVILHKGMRPSNGSAHSKITLCCARLESPARKACVAMYSLGIFREITATTEELPVVPGLPVQA